MALITFIGTFLTGTVFVYANIWGLVADMLLIFMVSMILLERTAVPVLFTAAGALVIDALNYAGMGFCTVPYIIVGICVVLFAQKYKKQNTLTAVAVVAVAYILKELITAVVALLMGYSFSFGYVFVRYSLGEAALSALITLVVYQLFKVLYRRNFMRPVKSSDEYDGV